MKIAVASSGLGHVARGIETWAVDTARGLHAQGVDVTLFTAGPLPMPGSGEAGAGLPIVVLPCWRRYDRAVQTLMRWAPGPLWRWGLKSGYGWEQLSFWKHMGPVLRRGHFDILHVQDPMVAYWCMQCRRLGLVATKEILAHGTEEPASFLGRFPYVQHLAPWHLEQVRQQLQKEYPSWTVMPNFVDVGRFRPAASRAEQRNCRRKFGLEEEGILIGTAAAVKKHHKRIDYLIKEFAAVLDQSPRSFQLVIVGSREKESDELIGMAKTLGRGRIHVLLDVPRADMPEFYRALDVFALTSLFEMTGIAVLEAMASGRPALVHNHPVLRWVVGEGGAEGTPAGGCALDMAAPGVLSEFLCALTEAWVVGAGQAARRRAEDGFSSDAVLRQYMDYYRSILTRPQDAGCRT